MLCVCLACLLLVVGPSSLAVRCWLLVWCMLLVCVVWLLLLRGDGVLLFVVSKYSLFVTCCLLCVAFFGCVVCCVLFGVYCLFCVQRGLCRLFLCFGLVVVRNSFGIGVYCLVHLFDTSCLLLVACRCSLFVVCRVPFLLLVRVLFAFVCCRCLLLVCPCMLVYTVCVCRSCGAFCWLLFGVRLVMASVWCLVFAV